MPPLSSLPGWADYVIIGGMALSEVLLVALPTLLWARGGRQDLREAFSWRRASGWEYVGAALMALGFLPWVQTVVVGQNYLWPKLMHSQDDGSAFLLPLLAHHPWLMVTLLPLSAAFSEELLFRGPIQKALLRRMSAGLAVTVGGLLFAAAHLDLPGFLVRAALGILLGVLVLRGRSIFPAMMLHGVYDAAALGGAAWDVHAHGLAATLQMAALPEMGVSRAELIGGPVVGTVLLALGWWLCVSAWRRREAMLPLPAPEAEPGTVWPPPPGEAAS